MESIRFREDWIIAEDAASFFFPAGTSWTALTEIRRKDGNGLSAGNIDVVLVAYDERGKLLDFGSLEVQAVYISGNVRIPFCHYMHNQTPPLDWSEPNYPRATYASASIKWWAPH